MQRVKTKFLRFVKKGAKEGEKERRDALDEGAALCYTCTVKNKKEEKTVRFQKSKSILPGRNGPDALFFFLLVLALVSAALGAIFLKIGLLVTALLLMGASLFRLLSRDLPRRHRENRLFLSIITLSHLRRAVQEKKEKNNPYLYCTCPSCSSRLRLARKSGDFTVTCAACKYRFSIHIGQ